MLVIKIIATQMPMCGNYHRLLQEGAERIADNLSLMQDTCPSEYVLDTAISFDVIICEKVACVEGYYSNCWDVSYTGLTRGRLLAVGYRSGNSLKISSGFTLIITIPPLHRTHFWALSWRTRHLRPGNILSFGTHLWRVTGFIIRIFARAVLADASVQLVTVLDVTCSSTNMSEGRTICVGRCLIPVLVSGTRDG